jgi:hypothetical protein
MGVILCAGGLGAGGSEQQKLKDGRRRNSRKLEHLIEGSETQTKSSNNQIQKWKRRRFRVLLPFKHLGGRKGKEENNRNITTVNNNNNDNLSGDLDEER